MALEQVRLTPLAEDDLAEIWSYSAETWSDEQADGYIDGLFDTMTLLAGRPQMARERTEFDPPVRIHPSRRHLIVYLAERDGILVVRVLGARQDWAAILQDLDA
ncbi:type II toxin-antitoxin system RelE/ParE family toxin [Tranquillimonas alkanivorans]|uniref:Toxin n=1 Tax=Tranquillimonas alkanivorans TaxID=441119 RepID=A0A1I5UBQ7_9RHOB|nr:type II toxin-antitoxin system RelE/ParE family toxin [Tranquillimonas alkanivorans]SFP92397.1 toxin ParE1/3/4 [Tranquillimonas alkanivorans]